jgi:hypothetical protein
MTFSEWFLTTWIYRTLYTHIHGWATEQASCPGTTSKKPSQQANHPDPSHSSSSSSSSSSTPSLGTGNPGRSRLRPLTELDWPLVDQDRLAVFSDPLRKDEIKPIRQHEWELIGAWNHLSSSNYLRRNHLTNVSHLYSTLIPLFFFSSCHVTKNNMYDFFFFWCSYIDPFARTVGRRTWPKTSLDKHHDIHKPRPKWVKKIRRSVEELQRPYPTTPASPCILRSIALSSPLLSARLCSFW